MDIIQDENKNSSSDKTVDSLEDISEKVVSKESTNKDLNMPPTNDAEEENIDSIKNTDVMSKSCSEDFANPQKAQAFTIDFGDGKQIDTSKHKFLMDKLKKRHQRGSSLSKLEDPKTSKTTMTKSKTSQAVSKITKPDSNPAAKHNIKISDNKPKAKMPMSVSFHETSSFGLESKSLSPRTSFHEHYSEEVNLYSLPNISTHDKSLESQSQLTNNHEVTNDVVNDCNDNESNSDVSETGTYTIENDTYTEEQKAKMSIDQKQNINNVDKSCDNNIKIRNTVKPMKNISKTIINSENLTNDFTNNEYTDNLMTNGNKQYTPSKVSSDKNVLEVSYYYEPQDEIKAKNRTSVLEKLKNRVRNISERTLQHKPKQSDNNLDMGSFTSVTASGVLSNKNPPSKNKNEFGVRNELDMLLKRKKSLTKSEIESSDYVEPESKFNNTDVCESNKSVKTNNKFEHNWIYEWAKSASEHNRRQRDKSNNQYLYEDSRTNNNGDYYGDKQNSHRAMSLPLGRTNNDRINESIVRRPPRPPSASPTKIPSPISTLARPRSRNSISLSGSTTVSNDKNINKYCLE